MGTEPQTTTSATTTTTTTPHDVVCDNAKLLLDQVRDAVSEIECLVDEINDRIAELCGLDDLPEDVADLAEGLQLEAGDVSDAALSFDNCLVRLHKAIAARTAATAPAAAPVITTDIDNG